MGVMGPIIFKNTSLKEKEKARRYNEPEKQIIPAKNKIVTRFKPAESFSSRALNKIPKE